jgi:hypothetical protein
MVEFFESCELIEVINQSWKIVENLGMSKFMEQIVQAGEVT